VGFGVGVDIFFEEFASEADGGEEGDAREQAEEF
jgi:hypothetical protein